MSPYPPKTQRKEDMKDRSRKAKESDLSTSLEGWMLQKSTYGYVKAGMCEDVHWGQLSTSSEGGGERTRIPTRMGTVEQSMFRTYHGVLCGFILADLVLA